MSSCSSAMPRQRVKFAIMSNATGALNIRKARREDVPTIVALLSDDPLGAQREDLNTGLDHYVQTFAHIEKDENQYLVVAEKDGQIVGTLHLTLLPYLTYQGQWRAQIEAVRVSKEYRSHGFGRQLFDWAVGKAKEEKCHMVQLTTDKRRPNALRFYEDLGFEATHEGMKLHL